MATQAHKMEAEYWTHVSLFPHYGIVDEPTFQCLTATLINGEIGESYISCVSEVRADTIAQTT